MTSLIDYIEGTIDGPQKTTKRIQSIGLVFITEDEDGNFESFEPAITQSMLLEDDSEMSNVRDQCGRIENRSRGSKGFRYTVEGIVTNSSDEGDTAGDDATKNLTVDRMKQLRNASVLRINSDLHSGPVIIRNWSLAQNNEIIAIDVGRGMEQAFPFQMQIQQPE